MVVDSLHVIETLSINVSGLYRSGHLRMVVGSVLKPPGFVCVSCTMGGHIYYGYIALFFVVLFSVRVLLQMVEVIVISLVLMA
jgi:hypothetical protein